MSEKNTVALNERDSSSLLSSCGVRMVASVLLDKPDRAAFEAASRQLGFPVAMKVLSDDILHKTDVGCVVLNVTDVDGMQAAYDTIMANAAKNAPGARVQGVLAEQMLPKGFEVLLGVSTDPQFGHVIMAGLGGVLVELLHAVSLRVLPITRQDAEDMIDETPLAKACQGLRGQQYRREEIVEALMCLSRLVEEHPENQVYHPNCTLVLDPSLLISAPVFDGLTENSYFIVNTKAENGADLVKNPNVKTVAWLDATSIALEMLGRPITNTIMLGAFVRATGWVDKDELEKVICRFFGEKNVETFRRGYNEVKLYTFE